MKNTIIKGAFILSAAGIITRFIGFYNRIFLAESIGAEGVGLYQMIFPIYGLCVSFAVSGVETAISKYVAEIADKSSDNKNTSHYLCAGFRLSILLSLLTAALLYFFRQPLAIYFVGDKRCNTLLKYVAFAIPLCSVHGCIIGFFMGKSKMHIPAIAQLAEQLIRVGSLFLFLAFHGNTGYASPSLAMFALVLGEFASSAVCLMFLYLQEKQFLLFSSQPVSKNDYKKIISMSGPLSTGRVITALILSFEAVLIVKGLESYGLLHSNAISVYGIFTGMALPFILFPSTITTALSSAILPSISKAQSVGNHTEISDTTTTVVRYCFSIGIFFTALFYIYGKDIGIILFSNNEAGLYIHILSWICPFLYLGTTLNSILNGLGKAGTTFFINVSISCLRIGILYFLVSSFGIRGYLWSILLSQIANACLLLYFVKKHTAFSYSLENCLLLPCIYTFFSIGLGYAARSLLSCLTTSSFFLLGTSVASACLSFFLLLIFRKAG